jgi:uncharacterized RDD family membrane protein YckC
MAQELLILNPEKTVLSFSLARLASRISAQILDGILLFVFMMIVSAIAQALTTNAFEPNPLVMGAAIVIISLGPFAYFILLEGLWNGQTLGKKALNIRVRMADGTPVTFSAALARNLMRPADFLPIGYFVGILAMFTNRKSQRLGDMVAQTIVTMEKRAEPRFSPAPYILGVHPFEQHVGELRGMNSDQYTTFKRLCDRFPELPTAVQNRLIHEVWEPFAERFKISPLPNVHPIYLAEAVVMKYGRSHGLL